MANKIGNRVKKVYQKNGTAITIKSGDTLTELPEIEYVDTELSNQATKPFILTYYLRAYFPYDTKAVVGDVITTNYDNQDYIITTFNNSPFRNEIIEKEAVVYKTNTKLRIQYKTEALDPKTYNTILTWVDRYSLDIPCLLTNTRFGNEISDYENIGELILESLVVYVSRHFEIKELDRLVFESGEVLKVDSISRYQYGYLYEIKLSEDNRE